MNLSELARITFAAQLERMQLNLDGCIEGKDPVHLHDLRVANRRLRAALIEFEDLLPAALFQTYQGELRWIHEISGGVRDLDVGTSFLPYFESKVAKDWQPYLAPALSLLSQKHQSAQKELAEILRGQRVRDLMASAPTDLVDSLEPSSQLGLDSAREYGCRRIITRYSKLRSLGLGLTKESSPEEYHNFRIQLKKLRYQIDVYAPVLDQQELERLRIELKAVQDTLGIYQDTVVQIHFLKQLADDLLREGAEAQPLLAVGQLIGSYEKQNRSYRKEAYKHIRWMVGDPAARAFQSCFQYPVN